MEQNSNFIDIIIFIIAFLVLYTNKINLEYKKVEEKILELMLDGLRYKRMKLFYI